MQQVDPFQNLNPVQDDPFQTLTPVNEDGSFAQLTPVDKNDPFSTMTPINEGIDIEKYDYLFGDPNKTNNPFKQIYKGIEKGVKYDVPSMVVGGASALGSYAESLIPKSVQQDYMYPKSQRARKAKMEIDRIEEMHIKYEKALIDGKIKREEYDAFVDKTSHRLKVITGIANPGQYDAHIEGRKAMNKWVRDKQQEGSGFVRKEGLVSQLSQIEEPADIVNFLFTSIGEMIPTMAASLVTAGAGGVVLETGDIYISAVDKIAEEKGITPEEVIEQGFDAPALAMAGGFAAGSLEFIGAGNIVSKFGKKALGKSLKKRGYTVLKSGNFEGGTEAAQQLINEVVGNISSGRELSNIDPMALAEAYAKGFAGSGGLTTVSQSFGTLKDVKEISDDKKIEKKKAIRKEVIDTVLAMSEGEPLTFDDINVLIEKATALAVKENIDIATAIARVEEGLGQELDTSTQTELDNTTVAVMEAQAQEGPVSEDTSLQELYPLSGLLGRTVVYNSPSRGEVEGQLVLDGRQVLVVENSGVEHEIGTDTEILFRASEDFGISQKPTNVSTREGGVFVVKNSKGEAKVYRNAFSDPTQAIIRDEDGNVTGVELVTDDTKSPQRRVFKGQNAQDLAYEIEEKSKTPANLAETLALDRAKQKEQDLDQQTEKDVSESLDEQIKEGEKDVVEQLATDETASTVVNTTVEKAPYTSKQGPVVQKGLDPIQEQAPQQEQAEPQAEETPTDIEAKEVRQQLLAQEEARTGKPADAATELKVYLDFLKKNKAALISLLADSDKLTTRILSPLVNGEINLDGLSENEASELLEGLFVFLKTGQITPQLSNNIFAADGSYWATKFAAAIKKIGYNIHDQENGISRFVDTIQTLLAGITGHGKSIGGREAKARSMTAFINALAKFDTGVSSAIEAISIGPLRLLYKDINDVMTNNKDSFHVRLNNLIYKKNLNETNFVKVQILGQIFSTNADPSQMEKWRSNVLHNIKAIVESNKMLAEKDDVDLLGNRKKEAKTTSIAHKESEEKITSYIEDLIANKSLTAVQIIEKAKDKLFSERDALLYNLMRAEIDGMTPAVERMHELFPQGKFVKQHNYWPTVVYGRMKATDEVLADDLGLEKQRISDIITNNQSTESAQQPSSHRIYMRTSPTDGIYDLNSVTVVDHFLRTSLYDIYGTPVLKKISAALNNKKVNPNREGNEALFSEKDFKKLVDGTVNRALKIKGTPSAMSPIVRKLEYFKGIVVRAKLSSIKQFFAQFVPMFFATAIWTSPSALLKSTGWVLNPASFRRATNGKYNSVSDFISTNGLTVPGRDAQFDIHDPQSLRISKNKKWERVKRVAEKASDFGMKPLAVGDKGVSVLNWLAAFLNAGGDVNSNPTESVKGREALQAAERSLDLLGNVSVKEFAPDIFSTDTDSQRLLVSMFLYFKSFALNQSLGAIDSINAMTSKTATREGKITAFKFFAAQMTSAGGYYILSQLMYLLYEELIDSVSGDEDKGEDEKRTKEALTVSTVLLNATYDLMLGGYPAAADASIRTMISGWVKAANKDRKEKDKIKNPFYEPNKYDEFAMLEALGGYEDPARVILEEGVYSGGKAILSPEEIEFTEEDFWKYAAMGLLYAPFFPMKGDLSKLARQQYKNIKDKNKRKKKNRNRM